MLYDSNRLMTWKGTCISHVFAANHCVSPVSLSLTHRFLNSFARFRQYVRAATQFLYSSGKSLAMSLTLYSPTTPGRPNASSK